jgi:hypothetical protein
MAIRAYDGTISDPATAGFAAGWSWAVRRQAYEAVLAGALMGHAFGQKHLYQFDADWRKALDSPGSKQMVYVKQLFASRPWHRLVPDERHEFVVRGYGYFGEVEYTTAARASDGSFAMVYCPTSRQVTVDLAKLRGAVSAVWFDPTDGSTRPVVGSPFPNTGERELRPPAKNAAGDADFVLILEAATNRSR